jgi:hypothetical protein
VSPPGDRPAMLRGLSLRHDGPAVLIVEASRVRDELWAKDWLPGQPNCGQYAAAVGGDVTRAPGYFSGGPPSLNLRTARPRSRAKASQSRSGAVAPPLPS